MPVVSAWVVPHAPVLVPGLSRRSPPTPPDIDVSGADVVVLVSPHGRSSGVYAHASGSLDSFGIPNRERSAPPDDGAHSEIAAAWGGTRLDQAIDHGALVPLWWMASATSVVACALAEVTGPGAPASYEEVWEEASALASAVETLASRRSVALVASAHLSAGLTPGAPLTEIEGARAFDRRVLDRLERSPRDLLQLPPREWAAAGACGMGPLLTLGHLWTGPLPVTSYSHPFGVGYVAAGRVA